MRASLPGTGKAHPQTPSRWHTLAHAASTCRCWCLPHEHCGRTARGWSPRCISVSGGHATIACASPRVPYAPRGVRARVAKHSHNQGNFLQAREPEHYFGSNVNTDLPLGTCMTTVDPRGRTARAHVAWSPRGGTAQAHLQWPLLAPAASRDLLGSVAWRAKAAHSSTRRRAGQHWRAVRGC